MRNRRARSAFTLSQLLVLLALLLLFATGGLHLETDALSPLCFELGVGVGAHFEEDRTKNQNHGANRNRHHSPRRVVFARLQLEVHALLLEPHVRIDARPAFGFRKSILLFASTRFDLFLRFASTLFGFTRGTLSGLFRLLLGIFTCLTFSCLAGAELVVFFPDAVVLELAQLLQ